MGSCTVLSHRHLNTRCFHLERLCCGAAPARSPATTYQEAGARNLQSKEALRPSPQKTLQSHNVERNHEGSTQASAILNCSPVELLSVHDTVAANACLVSGAHVASTADELVATPAIRSFPALQTPCLSTEAQFLLPSPGQLRSGQQVMLLQQPRGTRQDSLQEADPQQQHLHTYHYQPPHTAQSADYDPPASPGAGGVDSAQVHFQRGAAPAATTASYVMSYQGNRTVSIHAPLPPSSPPPQEALSPAAQQWFGFHPRQVHRRQHLDEQHSDDGGCVGSAAAAAAADELPSYLDAASRTAGVASTSARLIMPAVGPTGLRLGVEVAIARRRGARTGVYSADRERISTAPAPPLSGSDGCTSAADTAATPGLVLAAAVAATGAVEVELGGASGISGHRKGGSRTRSGSAGGGVSVAAKKQRAGAPSATEHRALRLRARLQHAALLPRAPTEEDLRLTVRITCTSHWRDLISLLAEHRERCNQRDLQERLQPYLQRSAKLQQPRRRGRGGGGSGGAAAISTAAASAAAVADVAAAAPGAVVDSLQKLPVSALPLTPQHVAAALLRTWQLLTVMSGPLTPAEARALAATVDWLARLAARMATSPGTSLRELATIFYAFVRLRHPLSKSYYLVLMNEARKRFTAPHLGPTGPPLRSTWRRQEGAGSNRANGRDASAPSMPYNAQDMSQLLWAIANCGMHGLRGDWAMSYCSALLPVVSELTPQGVGMVLHSLARLRCTPPPELLAALCRRLVHLTGYDDDADVGVDGGRGDGCCPLQDARLASAAAAAPADPSSGCDSRRSGAAHQVGSMSGGGGRSAAERQKGVGAQQQQEDVTVAAAGDGPEARPLGLQGSQQQYKQVECDDLAGVAAAAHGSGPLWGVHGLQGPPLPSSPSLPPQRKQQQRQRHPQRQRGVQRPSAGGQLDGGATESPLVSPTRSPEAIPVGRRAASSVGDPSPAPPSALSHQPAIRPADVSMTMWALATLRLPPGGYCPQMLPAVERYSLPRLAEFPEQELSNLVWALARLQYTPSQDWVGGLYDAILWLLPELRPQALSTLLYGLAQMGQRPDAEWLDTVLPYVRSRLRWFPPQSLALTIHALAVMGCRPPDAWLVAFHAQLDAYRGQLDMRVRSKVREAYRLMEFRPGAAASGVAVAEAAAVPAAAAAAAALDPANAQGQEQQQQAAATLHTGRQGSLAHAAISVGKEGGISVSEEVSLWRLGTPQEPPKQEQRQHEEGQDQPQQQHEEGEEEGMLFGLRLQQRRRGEASSKGKNDSKRGASRDSDGAAADEGHLGQVLVRPSRFVF